MRGERDSTLLLILPVAVGIGNLARFTRSEKKHLREAFISVNLCGQRCGVGNLQGDVPLPFWLEWCHVHDDATAGVCAFAKTDAQDVSRDAEILNAAAQREGVRRDDANARLQINE